MVNLASELFDINARAIMISFKEGGAAISSSAPKQFSDPFKNNFLAVFSDDSMDSTDDSDANIKPSKEWLG